ncbi:hypothetical protein [Pararhizobium qamdonense]|uniref:hypothetical protein n=1 Tax=Pararhizobium qamdonense TaxID=3031126 RepID=UPI0023E28D47|nr:hypothetical protein [Pararhizobium qamdonense]
MSVSKSREHAEVAFGHLQSQFFARGNAVEEMDHVTKSREEKTSRLREARLAKEEQDRLSASTKPAVKTRKRA